MIPQHIHWGMFGPWRPGALNQRCFDSWLRVGPQYSQTAWNDSNLPDVLWVRAAARDCPINCHNYMLLWSIWRYGGVAMDNDVEMIRPFDLNHGLFVGFQKDHEMRDCLNNCVIASVPGHPLIRRILDRIELLLPTFDPVHIGCGLLTAELQAVGMRTPGLECKIGDVMIYGKDRFSPFGHSERHDPMKVTDRTFAVHHYQGSWLP